MAQVNIRIDDSLRKQADDLFRSMGMTFSAAINIFVAQVVREGRMPFAISAQTYGGSGGKTPVQPVKKGEDCSHAMRLPIRAQRLYIGEFDESMAGSVHKNSLDEDNRRFVPDEVFESAGEARSRLSKLISYYPLNDVPLVYPIILNSGQHIGHVQAVPLQDGWEIGYHVAKDFSGRGYATEAVQAFLPIIMRRLDITQIHGLCHADNTASRRVLEKCGFKLESEGLAPYHGEKHRVCRYKYTGAAWQPKS